MYWKKPKLQEWRDAWPAEPKTKSYPIIFQISWIANTPCLLLHLETSKLDIHPCLHKELELKAATKSCQPIKFLAYHPKTSFRILRTSYLSIAHYPVIRPYCKDRSSSDHINQPMFCQDYTDGFLSSLKLGKHGFWCFNEQEPGKKIHTILKFPVFPHWLIHFLTLQIVCLKLYKR